MIVSEYIAECNATVREKLEELYEKHGRDDSLAYAAYRWGFALVDAQIPETGYIELLGKASDSFIKAKAEMDDVVDELIDTYGDGFVEEVHIRHAVHQLLYLGRHVHLSLHAEVDDRFVDVTAGLGCDNHDAVGSSRTIHGGGGGIFQDREALDDFGVDEV